MEILPLKLTLDLKNREINMKIRYKLNIIKLVLNHYSECKYYLNPLDFEAALLTQTPISGLPAHNTNHSA